MRDKLLQYQIVYGIQDTTLREELLQEWGLNLPKCIDKCRAAESATQQARHMADGGQAQAEVNRVTVRQGPGGFQGSPVPTGPTLSATAKANPSANAWHIGAIKFD